MVALSQKYGARIMVDDAHSMGVMGGGRGTAAHFGLNDQVDLIMSTFSKSFASLGGFVAGEASVIDYIKHHARALIFSASIPASNAAAALAALHVMQEEPDRIERVIRHGEKMRAGFQSLGFDIGASATPVVPIIIGDDERTFLTWKLLFEKGVFVEPGDFSRSITRQAALAHELYGHTHR
jgi:7-keto-8-aminopelargonate synthetase-like enzyme